jgi:hypothetical protein
MAPSTPLSEIKPETAEVIELSFPATADLVVLARLTATTIASWAGLDVEEIEDLRLAVDEVCVSLARRADPNNCLRLVFNRRGDSVEVFFLLDATGARRVNVDHPGAIDELPALFLDALVDWHAQEIAGGHYRAWLRKEHVRTGSDD